MASILDAVADHRRKNGSNLHPVRFLEDRYQALIANYYETGKSPLPCTALSSSCFVDAYWDLYPCSIWDEKVGNLRDADFDLGALWESERRRSLRRDVAEENCSHCWTPCEAYPTILGNLAKAVTRAPEHGAAVRLAQSGPPRRVINPACLKINSSHGVHGESRSSRVERGHGGKRRTREERFSPCSLSRLLRALVLTRVL